VREGVARLERVNADLVTELAWQMGRPVRYGGEMGGVRERTDYMAGIAEAALAPEVVEESPRFRRLLAREPLGLVFVIAPWNYPYLTAINTIVPALIAGNAVVLKHASQTLLAGERLAAAFAHLPEGVFTNLFLDHATTEELIRGRAFDFVNFTGSVEGGRAIERAAAGTFVGTGLELGGKDPAYVRADADLEAAVETLMDGAMYNSGQCCCGIERIYVDRSLYDAFVEKSVALVSGYRSATRSRPATTLGPMAHKRFADTVRGQIAEAVAAGATPLVDPGRFPADTGEDAYLAPQILTGVDHSMRVMTEESFGPVVGIMPVEGDEEAIAADERLPLRPDRQRLDRGPRHRAGDRRAARDRHGVHEPRRLPRPGALLDRLQGHRPRRRALAARLPQPDPAEVLPPAAPRMTAATWSFPTRIRFGAGRIAELAEACRAAGIARPLFVTDPGLAPLEITERALGFLRAGGAGRGLLRGARQPHRRRRRGRARRDARRAGTTASSPSAAARRSTRAR
jgi:hypothetical protein